MKQEIEATQSGSNDAAMIPLTLDGVTARLKQFSSTAAEVRSQGSERHLVNSAIRNSGYDVAEAKVKRELKKLGSSSESSPDTLQREQELAAELEAIKASRKIGEILDGLIRAREEMKAIDSKTITAMNNMAAMKAQAAALETKISDLRATDNRAEINKIPNLENELRWVQGLLTDGNWKQTSIDYRGDALAAELEGLTEQDKYHGAPTLEGAEARIIAIEQQLAGLNQLDAFAFGADAIARLRALESELLGINVAIAKATPAYEEISEAGRIAEERFGELVDSALITAKGVIEVYQIASERIATHLPA